MSISSNIAAKMLRYKLDHELTTVELASELHLAVSTTQEYLNGNGNPRADTLETIAQQMGVSVNQLISPLASEPTQRQTPAPRQPQAASLRHTRAAARLAKEFARLPPDKRGKGIQLFLEMVELWSEIGKI